MTKRGGGQTGPYPDVSWQCYDYLEACLLMDVQPEKTFSISRQQGSEALQSGSGQFCWKRGQGSPSAWDTAVEMGPERSMAESFWDKQRNGQQECVCVCVCVCVAHDIFGKIPMVETKVFVLREGNFTERKTSSDI